MAEASSKAGIQPTGEVRDSTRGFEISEALAELEESDRDLLLLYAWEGMTSNEIATVVGSNSAAIRMRLSRARRKFEQALEPSIDTISVREGTQS